MTQRTAIILFNLGGPDGQAAVQPFLFNLFNDPAIISLPNPLRWLVAKLISSRRAPVAREIYQKMGGGSPILPNTVAQAQALETALGDNYKCFIAMRYWKPRAAEVVRAVEAYKPERLVLLPLYPQFSTTTTESSLKEFRREVAQAGGWLHTQWEQLKPVSINCYPVDDGFVRAQAALIAPFLREAAQHGRPRLLLSSHGLPKKVVTGGDPYQWQCEQGALRIIDQLKAMPDLPAFDWLNTYQSRVGPLEWIGPSTEAEVERAGHDKVPLVLAPMAFVSEHSETLVELDIEYRELAHEKGVPFYGRVPAVGTHPDFIAGLAALVQQRLQGITPSRQCPAQFGRCICTQQEAA